MAILRAKRRNALPKSDFGLPGSRKYPVEDKPHARAAKAYASKEANAGKLSGSAKAQIDRKADRVLGARDGGGRGTIMASRGKGEAPRNDAGGYKRGARGSEGPQFGNGKPDDMGPPRAAAKDKATAGGQVRMGARDGLGMGKGGLASHSNMASMHGDRTMRHERY